MDYLFSRTTEDQVRLTVDWSKKENAPINPRIFGNFFEHLGFAVQGGILAQLLMNPGLHGRHYLPPSDLRRLRENGDIAEKLHRLSSVERAEYAHWRPNVPATGFGALVLDDQTDKNVPLPWRIVPEESGRGRQPGRVGHSVELSLSTEPVSLQQGVFAPHHRELRYQGHIWVKAIGEPGRLQVEMRRRTGSGSGEGGSVLARQELAWPQEVWTKLPFELEVPPDSLLPLEAVDFCIVASGSGRLWVDRAVLLPADHVDGFDPEVLDAARRLAPPVLRGPGGNFVSGYHFWHGIGGIDNRQTFPNPAWGGLEDNLFGTDELLRLCELIGAEPHICVNMGDGTAEEAAAWVEYVNGSSDSYWGRKRAANGHPEPYGVKLWEIGNEIYGPWQVGHCGADENARRFKEWSQAMRAVDPTIEILGTGSCFDFVESQHHWHQTLLEEGSEHLDSITLHGLPNNVQEFAPDADPEHIWLGIMAHTVRWENTDLPALLDLAHRLRPEKEIDLSITEWGPLGRPDRAQVTNLGGAIYAGLFLNMAIRKHNWLRVANATAILHGGSIRKVGPLVFTDPQVEVIRRYTLFGDGEAIPVACAGPGYNIEDGIRTAPEVKDVPYIDAVGVHKQNGQVEVAVVNRHPRAALPVHLQLAEAPGLELVTAEEMTGETLAEKNTPLAPERVVFAEATVNKNEAGYYSFVAEPHSITWLTWQLSDEK